MKQLPLILPVATTYPGDRDKLQEMFPEIETDLARELKVENVLARRNAIGGTAPSRVKEAVLELRMELESWRQE